MSPPRQPSPASMEMAVRLYQYDRAPLPSDVALVIDDAVAAARRDTLKEAAAYVKGDLSEELGAEVAEGILALSNAPAEQEGERPYRNPAYDGPMGVFEGYGETEEEPSPARSTAVEELVRAAGAFIDAWDRHMSVPTLVERQLKRALSALRAPSEGEVK